VRVLAGMLLDTVAAAAPTGVASAAVVAAPLQPSPNPDADASEPAAARTPGAASRARDVEQRRARDRADEQQRAPGGRAAGPGPGCRSQEGGTTRGGGAARAGRVGWTQPSHQDGHHPIEHRRSCYRRSADEAGRPSQGPLTLGALDSYLSDTWLSIIDGTAQLSAAVVLTPRTTLDVGGEAKTLKLAGGTTLPEAASIYTGSGGLILNGVTVTSSDQTFEQAQPPSAGRPFIVVATGGRLEATDSRSATSAPAHQCGRPARRTVQHRQRRLPGPHLLAA
jgi:hypothetical protein